MFKSKKLKKRPIKEIDYVYKPPVSKTDRNIYEVMTPDKKMDTKDLWVCEMDQSKGNITSLKGDVLPHLGKTQIIDGMNVTNSWAIAAYWKWDISKLCSVMKISLRIFQIL